MSAAGAGLRIVTAPTPGAAANAAVVTGCGDLELADDDGERPERPDGRGGVGRDHRVVRAGDADDPVRAVGSTQIGATPLEPGTRARYVLSMPRARSCPPSCRRTRRRRAH